MCRHTISGTGQRRDLSGRRSACGTAANLGTRCKPFVARLGGRGDQLKRWRVLRRRGCIDGLVAQMANRAARFRRAVMMMMVLLPDIVISWHKDPQQPPVSTSATR